MCLWLACALATFYSNSSLFASYSIFNFCSVKFDSAIKSATLIFSSIALSLMLDLEEPLLEIDDLLLLDLLLPDPNDFLDPIPPCLVLLPSTIWWSLFETEYSLILLFKALAICKEFIFSEQMLIFIIYCCTQLQHVIELLHLLCNCRCICKLI